MGYAVHIYVYRREHLAVTYPVLQGYEYAAVEEAVGAKVEEIEPGMRVTARPQVVCGYCPPCRRDAYNVC